MTATITTTRIFSSSSYHYRHSLQSSRLKDLLRDGKPIRGVVSGQYRDTDHIEMLGLLGYDFLWADAEHSSASPSDVAQQIVAADCRGLPTLVRVGFGYQNIIGHVQKFLVSGANGIILPQCESASDAQRLVEAVKFPPIGRRGLAGERWNAWGMAKAQDGQETTPLSIAECVEQSNDNSIVGVMLETRKGLDAIDEVLEVPELDFVFIAPTDLSADLGHHGQIRHPEVIELIEQAGKKIHDFNKKQGPGGRHIAAGMLVLNEQDYVFWRERGFQVLVGVAQIFFVNGAKKMIDSMNAYEHENTENDE